MWSPQEQMRALFGAGLHPLAMERQRQLQGPDLTVRDYAAVTRLGAPFKIYQPDVSPFRLEVAKRIAAFNQAAGLPGDWAVPAADQGPDPHRGGPRVLRRRAREPAGGCPGASSHDRQAFPAADPGGRRL